MGLLLRQQWHIFGLLGLRLSQCGLISQVILFGLWHLFRLAELRLVRLLHEQLVVGTLGGSTHLLRLRRSSCRFKVQAGQEEEEGNPEASPSSSSRASGGGRAIAASARPT